MQFGLINTLATFRKNNSILEEHLNKFIIVYPYNYYLLNTRKNIENSYFLITTRHLLVSLKKYVFSIILLSY